MNTRSDRYDVVVVGAGIMGCAAAYHCAQDGKRVLILEQFALGHALGSSHGGSRIFRYVHDRVDDAREMPATFQLWRRLERDSGRNVLRMTGGLYMSPAADTWITRAIPVLDALGWPYRLLRGAELRANYPQFAMPQDWIGVAQPDAGILSPPEAMAALLVEAQKRGTSLREKCRVLDISPVGEGVRVLTANGDSILAGRVIVCAGPWSSRLLERLVDFSIPLAVTRQQVAYFPVRDPALFEPKRCPIFVTAGTPHIYGFPIHERGKAIKVALANDTKVGTDPDGPREVQPGLLAELCDVIRRHMVGVTPEPLIAEACLYTETPTCRFVIDRHPEFPQLVFAAGFSGRGFKHAIAIGRLLADLAGEGAEARTSPFWKEDYRITRFADPVPPRTAARLRSSSSASSQGR